MTVREVSETWLRTQRHSVKPSTYIKYQSVISTYISPHLGDIQMCFLNQGIIEGFVKELLQSGKKNRQALAPKTVSDILSVLKRIIVCAEKYGIIVPCIPSEIHVKQSRKEICILSKEEQRRLCGSLYHHEDQRSLGILFCFFTGLRVGELCALRLEDISLEDQTVYIHKTRLRLQNPERKEGMPKTSILISTPKSVSSIRRIPLPCELVNILKDRNLPESGYFLSGREDKYCEPRMMQLYFQRVLKQCGMRSVNFHVVRHTFATRCVELGFDVKTLSEILGHSSVTITMNRYVHPTMDLKREHMERLSDLIPI